MNNMLDKSILVYIGTYYLFDNRLYGFVSDYNFLKALSLKYREVILLAPTKKVLRFAEINPLYIDISELHITIKVFPFFENRTTAQFKWLFYKKNINHLWADYCFISHIIYNSISIASFFAFKKIKVCLYIGSNPMEILSYPGIKMAIFKKLAGIIYIKKLEYDCKKFVCLINGQNLFNAWKLDKKFLVNSSTLWKFELDNRKFETDQNKLLFIGRLVPSKRVEILLEMLKIVIVKFPDVYLNIVGDGISLNVLKMRAHELGLELNVKFLGAITDRSLLHQEYKTAKLFVFPSSSEGNPRVIKEATFYNLPSISTRVGNLLNEYIDGHDILFVDFESSISMANQVIRMLEDEDYYSSIKDNVCNHHIHSLEDYIEEVSNVFEQL